MSDPSVPSSNNSGSSLDTIRSQTGEAIQTAKESVTETMRSAREMARRRAPHIGHQNVGEGERLGSLAAGAALIGLGIRKGGITGIVSALAGGSLIYRGATGHCDMYQALGINSAGPQSARASLVGNDGICVEKSLVVNRSPEDLYRFWRNFENLPKVMGHLESVTVRDGKHSHWVVQAPAGATVEWDAEIINERENELIAWRSLEEADVRNAGSVRFSPDSLGRGTWVKVSLMYQPPVGKLGAAVAKLFGEDPQHQIEEDLHRFKQFMETGEIPTIKGQASCREEE